MIGRYFIPLDLIGAAVSVVGFGFADSFGEAGFFLGMVVFWLVMLVFDAGAD